MKKYLFFISSGRCGTTRISEILKENLPEKSYTIVHQMRFSRLANVFGNLMFYFGESEKLKDILYSKIISRYDNENKHFISTDPLTAMIIPDRLLKLPNSYIVHIKREHEDFAMSMYNFTRKRLKSFIAHNLIPFWQIGLLPLENLLNKNIQHKYAIIAQKKNKYFLNKFRDYENYMCVDTKEIFSSNNLEKIILKTINESIIIDKEDLLIKSNVSSVTS